MTKIFNYLDNEFDVSTNGGVDLITKSQSVDVLFKLLDLKNPDHQSDLGLLLEQLWAIRSLDQLHQVFISLDSYLQEKFHDYETDERQHTWENPTRPANGLYLSSQSILGSFFRKCFLSFDALGFEDVARLWQSFRAFRMPVKDLYKQMCRGNPDFQDPDELSDLDRLESHFSSILDLENSVSPSSSHLEFVLDHQIDQLRLYASNISPNLIASLQVLSKDSVLLPSSAFLLEYYDACRTKDREKAFDSLHRYFDYTMENRGRSHYQYALFALASLQAEFDGTQEAMRAVEEAISVARENNDYNCLTEILSWLNAYMRLHPEVKVPQSLDNMDQIAQFLKTKSHETALNLSSLANQSEAIDCVLRGDSLVLPSEHLIKSSYTNIVTNSPGMAVQTHMVQSSLWSRCGVDILAQVYLGLAKDRTRTNVSEFTAARLYFASAFLKLKEGRVKEAQADMDSIRPANRSALYEQFWFPRGQLFQVHIALLENKLILARALINQLLSYTSADIQIEQEAKLADIRLDLLQGNTSTAVEKLSEQLDRAVHLNLDSLYHIQYMLLYIRAMGTSDYTRVFTVILRAMRLAEKKNLVPLRLEALLLLCRVFNAQKNYTDSASLLDLAMPRVFECGWIALIGEAYELLADAAVGQAGLLKQEEERRVLLEQGLYYISEASRCKYGCHCARCLVS